MDEKRSFCYLWNSYRFDYKFLNLVFGVVVMVRCPKCESTMVHHYSDVYICLKCKYKCLASNADKNNYQGKVMKNEC